MTQERVLFLALLCTIIVVASYIIIRILAWIGRRGAPVPASVAATTVPVDPAPYSPAGLGLLALSSLQSLIVGAVIDYCLGFLLVSLFGLAVYIPLNAKLFLALVPAVPLYMWSLNLHRRHLADHIKPEYRDRRGNYIPPFERGIVTRLGEIVPSGPDGKGLRTGYHWFPLGEPVFRIFKTQSIKEITIPFDNMQVWTKNREVGDTGMIEGIADGITQFQIEDPAKWNAVANPEELLNAIVLESARDVCEGDSIINYLGTKNQDLAKKIVNQINEILLTSNGGVPGRLGVRLVSVNVRKTDTKDKITKDSWSEVAKQEALAAARKTDADARVERIKTYKTVGVDANRAVAADLVADDKTGASVNDQRFNADVGQSLKDVTEALISKIPGGRP